MGAHQSGNSIDKPYIIRKMVQILPVKDESTYDDSFVSASFYL